MAQFNFGPTALSNRKTGIVGQITRGGMDVVVSNNIACTGATLSVTDEIQTFDYVTQPCTITLEGSVDILGDSIDWGEPNVRIVPNTLVITDLLNTFTYTENTDYIFDINTGQVTSLPDGAIGVNTSVLLNYSWQHDCFEAKTGGPWPLCPTCNGSGLLSSFIYETRGLFSMPNLQQTWSQGGYIDSGMHTLTTVFDIPINYTAENRGGFAVRDWIWVKGSSGVWIVSAEPSYSAMDGEFLFKVIPLKKYQYKGTKDPNFIRFPAQSIPFVDIPPQEQSIRMFPHYALQNYNPSAIYTGTLLPYTFFYPKG